MEILDVFKALSDETRLRILNLLHHEALCICELEVILKLSQSNASRHVTKLKNAKLIIGEKKAQWVYFRVDRKIFETYSFLNQLINDNLLRTTQCKIDLVQLKKYKESGTGCGYFK